MNKFSNYNYLFLIYAIISYISCFTFGTNSDFSKKNILINGKKFEYIFLSNEIDTIEGYFQIENDSFMYLSKYDYLNVDTMLCFGQYSKYYRKPYCLFSKFMKRNNKIYRNPCDRVNFNYKLVFPLNYVFPPEKIKPDLWKVKHLSTDYYTNNPFIREFFINGELQILMFKSQGDKNKFHFYYD